jgi:putative ABC transport system permease protein
MDDVFIRGVTANIIDIGTDKVASGRFFTETEYDRREQVAFIGTDIAERLFPSQDPLGKTISIDGSSFQVVGVAEKVGSALGQSQDNFVYIPLTTLHKIWGEGKPDDDGLWIAIKCDSPGEMEQMKDQARTLVRAQRREAYDEPDRFGIISSESVTGLWNDIFGGIANASIGLVSVFLVIGGIVIMNIMLAAVTERTREIGVRKALGAKRRDILMQFLIEASVMAAIGGLMGVLSATAVTQLLGTVTPMPMRMPLGAVLVSVGVASFIGIFFGLWPAVKASRLDPVVALRAEL